METEPTHTYELITIPFSHYNEKARFVLDYYRVPYTEHAVLPIFHVLATRPYKQVSSDPHTSPYATPVLLIRDARTKKVLSHIHDSAAISRYIASNYSTPELPDIHTTSDDPDIDSLDLEFSKKLGINLRRWAYGSLFTEKTPSRKWFGLWDMNGVRMGWRNSVGILQSLLWTLFFPLILRLILLATRTTQKNAKVSAEVVKEQFRVASEILKKKPYLGGDRLSIVDVTFASLGAYALGSGYVDGYGGWAPPPSDLGEETRKFIEECRETEAGKHILKVYKERKVFTKNHVYKLFGLF